MSRKDKSKNLHQVSPSKLYKLKEGLEDFIDRYIVGLEGEQTEAMKLGEDIHELFYHKIQGGKTILPPELPPEPKFERKSKTQPLSTEEQRESWKKAILEKFEEKCVKENLFVLTSEKLVKVNEALDTHFKRNQLFKYLREEKDTLEFEKVLTNKTFCGILDIYKKPNMVVELKTTSTKFKNSKDFVRRRGVELGTQQWIYEQLLKSHKIKLKSFIFVVIQAVPPYKVKHFSIKRKSLLKVEKFIKETTLKDILEIRKKIKKIKKSLGDESEGFRLFRDEVEEGKKDKVLKLLSDNGVINLSEVEFVDLEDYDLRHVEIEEEE